MPVFLLLEQRHVGFSPLGFGYAGFAYNRAAERWMFLESERILVYEFSPCHSKDTLGFLECGRNWLLLCRFVSTVNQTWRFSDIGLVHYQLDHRAALNYLKTGVESIPKTSYRKMSQIMDNVQHKVHIMN
jgi:hypothetical protein